MLDWSKAHAMIKQFSELDEFLDMADKLQKEKK
jgi:hypothetical protein